MLDWHRSALPEIAPGTAECEVELISHIVIIVKWNNKNGKLQKQI